MSKQACAKEILCIGKAINDLKSSVEYLEYQLNKAKTELGNRTDKEVEAGTNQAENAIKLGDKITKMLME